MTLMVGDKVRLAHPERTLQEVSDFYRNGDVSWLLGWNSDMDREYEIIQESRLLTVSRVGDKGNIKLKLPEHYGRDSWWYYASDFVKVDEVRTEII